MSNIDTDHLLKPISDESPAGNDARYEFCYEMMEAEVKKFGSLFGETVDWNVVKTNAMEVLEHHSKDLKALCYLVRALAEESGLKGFEQGLKLLNEALACFGSDLYPSRKRGRDGAVEWLNHQFKLMSTKLADSAQSWELVSGCISAIEEVQRQYDDVYQDSEADFFEIRTQLNVLSQQAAADDQSDDAIATIEQAAPATQPAAVEMPAQNDVQTASAKMVPP
ncbi:type VI secretion system ImpA family N-terminal domain-containing protein, partial [Vibrio antiquarius]